MGRAEGEKQALSFDEVTRVGFGEAMIDSEALELERRRGRLVALRVEMEECQEGYDFPLLNGEISLRDALLEGEPAVELQALLDAAIPHLLSRRRPSETLAAKLFNFLDLCGIAPDAIEAISDEDKKELLRAGRQGLAVQIERLQQGKVFVHSLRDFARDVVGAVELRAAQITAERFMLLPVEERFSRLFECRDRFSPKSREEAIERLAASIRTNVSEPSRLDWPEQERWAEMIVRSTDFSASYDVPTLTALLAIEMWPKAVRILLAEEFDEQQAGYREMVAIWRKETAESE